VDSARMRTCSPAKMFEGMGTRNRRTTTCIARIWETLLSENWAEIVIRVKRRCLLNSWGNKRRGGENLPAQPSEMCWSCEVPYWTPRILIFNYNNASKDADATSGVKSICCGWGAGRRIRADRG
jgi:hypothetical protein